MKSLIEQLEAGHSDALTAYLDAMSRFHNYSFGNILKIARQRPDATRVAGMYAWNQLGRKVKKGERGIRILAPIVDVKRKKDEETEKGTRSVFERYAMVSRGDMVDAMQKLQRCEDESQKSHVISHVASTDVSAIPPSRVN